MSSTGTQESMRGTAALFVLVAPALITAGCTRSVPQGNATIAPSAITLTSTAVPTPPSSPSAVSRTQEPVFRPATGTRVAGEPVSGGLGETTIHNRNQSDAVVVVGHYLQKEPRIAVYVRHGESFTIDRLSDGMYTLYVTTGTNRDPVRRVFTQNPVYWKYTGGRDFRTLWSTQPSRPLFHWTAYEFGLSRLADEADRIAQSDFPALTGA